MKTNRFVIIIFLGLSITRCDRVELDNDRNIDINSISFTDCNDNTKSVDSNTPTIRLTGQPGDKLLVKLSNTEFCCGTDSVSINKKNADNKIDLEIIDNGPLTYCFCPHNLEFLLGPFNKEDYLMTLIESEHAYSRDTFHIQFHYSQQIDTVITSNYDPYGNGQINHWKTIPGGCNVQDTSNLKSTVAENDTVITSIINDTLDIYAGINYICCAPFITSTNIINDSITIVINDTCSFPYETCYCKCMCYYTWDFLFTDLLQKVYNYKIILFNPVNGEPVIFREGKIENTNPEPAK